MDSAARKAFGRDLLNLTLASPSVNRHQKIAKDLAEWLPALNQCWYVNQVVKVKRTYNLTMDQAEAAVARRVLAGCARPIVMQFTDQGAAPAPPPEAAPAPPPASGGNCDSDPLRLLRRQRQRQNHVRRGRAARYRAGAARASRVSVYERRRRRRRCV